ncbi:MAG: T9SS type A sorting domain-containing protein [Bacteroidetes bacterium]|nr:T9SS type A sorting domain-containing protein [Bacteroidota bacterium]
MKKALLFLMALFLWVQGSWAQLSGTKTIPGDYASISAAVTALNAAGVGAGGVTFNVAAGYTEILAGRIDLTATGTLANPITFQKSGAGANPLITAYATGTGTPSSAVPDGMWAIVGSDYVTINGIDLVDLNAANPATMEYGYGLFKASAIDGCQSVTIKNCVITLNRINNASGTSPMVEGSVGILVINATQLLATTAITPTDALGTNSNNKFYTNTIQNVNYGIALSGYAAATPFTLGDTGNDIGGSILANGNTIINYGGAAAATNPSAGIRANQQWGVNISFNTVNNNNGSGVNHVSTLRGIYAQAGVSASANINNNTITLQSGATTSQVSGIENAIGSTAAGNTININNNTLQNFSYSTATSGTVYGIYNSSTAATLNVTNNVINNFNIAGTGTLYLIETGSAVTASVSNNSLSNVTKTGASGTIYALKTTSPTNLTVNGNTVENINWSLITSTGSIYGFYGLSSSVNVTLTNNIVRNLSTPTTGTLMGIREYGVSGTKTIQNNQVYNFSTTAGGAGGGSFVGYYFTTGNIEVSNNVVFALNSIGTTGGTAGYAYGIWLSGGTTNLIYKNTIYNLSSASTNPVVAGIYISSGTTTTTYNNMISDLRATAANAANPLNGIYITGGTTSNVYYNTVYLNGVSSGALFGSSAMYASSTPTVDMRNNIFINNSTPNGATGYTVAYRRSSTTLTSYSANSNNNDFYAGTPGANRLIYYDGTNFDQTIALYKSRVSPRDAASVTELPPFVNIATTPYNLHIQGAVACQVESGGAVISAPLAIIDDIDNNARYPNPGYPNNVSSPATAPDMGADEFAGVLLDLTPPTISFSALANTAGLGARTLTTTITDATGVPTAGAGLPVLYWRINAGAYTGVTATWVSGSQYTFTFGAGAVLGDVVSYYIVAQDIATTPNVGANPSGGASGYTINPPAAGTPPTTPYSYIIVGSLSGVYPVGVGQVYPTITAAVADLNLKEVVAPVTFELWDASYTAETLPLIINKPAGVSATKTVTFKPKAGVTSSVSGFHANGVFVLMGAEYIIFDGSNSGGTDRNLTIENTNTAASCYGIGIFHNGVQGAQNNTIKNCVVKLGGKTATNWAIILNYAGGGYHNTTIQNNELLNAYVGIQFVGVLGNSTNNCLVTKNIFGSDNDLLSLGNIGITTTYVDGLTLSENIFKNFSTGNNPKAINVSTNTINTNITGNNITKMIYTGTGGYGGKGIDINTGYVGSNLLVANNIITDLRGDGWSAITSDAIVGIRVLGTTTGVKIYHNSVNLFGTSSYNGATVCAALYVPATANFDVRDNFFSNSIVNTVSATGKAYAIYNGGTNTVFSTINYNDYYASGTQGVLGYQGADVTTLAAWSAATGQDLNSIATDPMFTSGTDLMPTNTAIDNFGTYLSDVKRDYADVARTNPPDIGALEFGTNPTIATTAVSNQVCQEVQLNGTVNANGLTVNTFFDYGETTAYGTSVAGTPASVSGSTLTNVMTSLVGLTPSTTYNYRIRVVTSGGVTSYGANMTFTTGALLAPTATTLPPHPIGNTTATLKGTVNAGCSSTTVTFEWGPTIAYGNTIAATQSPIGGGTDVAVSADLIGLGINSTYNYRVVATNGQGTTYGLNQVFTTGAAPPTVTTNAASNLGVATARLNSTVNANNQNATTSFEWGPTAAYGNVIAGVPLTVTGNVNTAVYGDLSGLMWNTTYYYRAVAVNTAGTTYGLQQTFTTVCPTPDPAGTITGPASICQNTTGHVYTVPAIMYATGYQWTVPVGGTIVAGSNTNSITVDYDATAVSGNVTVSGTNVCNTGVSSSLAVTLNALPVPVITGEDVVCVTSIESYSTASGMSGYLWTVSAGGQILSGQGTSQISVKWNVVGNQTVSATFTNASGCPALNPTVLNVNVSILPSPTIVGNDIVCQNSTEDHVYTTQEGFSNYSWDVTSGGTIVSGQGTYQILVYWTGTDDQVVSVNYYNGSGCNAPQDATFDVNILPKPAGAGAITGTSSVCTGDQNIAYSVSPIADAEMYHWTVPADATIVDGLNTNSILVNFDNNAASGPITVYASNGCGDGGMSPAYAVTVNQTPLKPIVTLEGYVLTSNAPAGNQWYFEGEIIDGATDQSYTADMTGNYSVVVTLNGCSSVPSEDVYVLITGLQENNQGKFVIYPVPNDGRFTVTITSELEESYDIAIYNNLGMPVYQVKDFRVKGASSVVIQLNNPSQGTYTVIFRNKDVVETRKVLVTK